MKNIIAALIAILAISGCRPGDAPEPTTTVPAPTATTQPPSPTETLEPTPTYTPTPTTVPLTYSERCAQLKHVDLADRNMVLSTEVGEDDEELFLIRGDGTIINQLTDNQVYDLYPHWSPDGSKLAYVVFEGREITESLHLLHFNGEKVVAREVIGLPEIESMFDPVWSPDGNRIAIGVRSFDSMNRIYLVDIDGSGYETIELEFLEQNPDPVSWSSDSQYLSFETIISPRMPYFIAFNLSIDDSEVEEIAPGGYGNESPYWHPTKDLVLLISATESLNPQIVLYHPMSGEWQQLTEGSEDYSWARWGPFEDFVIYATYSSEENSTDLHITNIDGTYQQVLYSNLPGKAWRPGLTSDGEYLAFITRTGGTEVNPVFDIFVLNMCKQEMTIIIKNADYSSTFEWRP